jgi:hypothetical protein
LTDVDDRPLGNGLHTLVDLKVDSNNGWVGVYVWGDVEPADGEGEEDAYYITFTGPPTNKARIKITPTAQECTSTAARPRGERRTWSSWSGPTR